MLVSHWMKAGVIVLWLAATAWVLNQCDRLLAPAKPAKTASVIEAPAAPKIEAPGDDAPQVPKIISDDARRRAEKRKAHEDKLARRRAEYEALEADLAAMIQNDIPSALDEFAKEASRFRNKILDLKNLKKADQWRREVPVKEALARARELTTEYYRVDLEAQQKGRDGPTLHSQPDIEALTKRIQLFKRGGEEIQTFAAALAPLHGKVPESLMLSAIDAIPQAVLPKDASIRARVNSQPVRNRRHHWNHPALQPLPSLGRVNATVSTPSVLEVMPFPCIQNPIPRLGG